MYKMLFETKADRTVESVQAAFLRETGENDWGYDTMEDIDRAVRYGFLEFEDGIMRIYADMN